ncbi:DUF6158 family protein [Micromonospora sp. NPDC049679]|uniref:DUF6158 family protein n=1 Tax=Micromonospora sp. NPDC049679 TaxID=3155920 RepID=UPI0033F75220
MTDSVRHGDYSPASSGMAFEPSAEPRRAGWDGDHARTSETLAEPDDDLGIDPTELTDEDLLREMRSLHRTRLDTLRHAADSALATHLRRTAELETEYLTRYPGREVDPDRLREGD